MNNLDFTQGKMLPKILKFAFPLVCALLLQALYGAVDLIVVGQFGDASSIAAVATGSHIMQTITNIITGFTMGITVLVGKFVGSKENHKIGATIGNAIVMFAIFAVVITALMIGLARTFVNLMSVPQEAVEKCIKYTIICSAGTIFITAYNVISGIFRGLGNSNLPLFFIFIACIVNILGDLFFIGYLKLDAVGAAIATVIAQAVSVIISLIVIRKKKVNFEFSKDSFKLKKEFSLSILKIGSPIALQDGLTNLSFLIIGAFINKMGLEQAASVGIAEKLFVFLALVPLAMMSTMATVVSQNEGAKKSHRSHQAVRIGIVISCVFGVATALFTVFGGDILARIFNNDSVVVGFTKDYLHTSGWEYLLLSFYFIIMGYLNGKGKTFFVMVQGLISAFLIRIPLSWYLSSLENSTMGLVGYAIPCSALAGLFMCLTYYFIISIKEKKAMDLEKKKYFDVFMNEFMKNRSLENGKNGK